MRKFGEVVKEKIQISDQRQENKILEDFKTVYNSMLEHYGLQTVRQLDEESQLSFLTELNHYWSEEEGLSEKGQQFLEKRSMELNEASTATQKKNFLKAKSYAVINETLRQSGLKTKLYDVIDEMYNQLKASDVSDILSPDMITNIITESFTKSLTEFTSRINKELNDSVKVEPKKKYFIKVKTK